jgi:hypothetical protein
MSYQKSGDSRFCCRPYPSLGSEIEMVEVCPWELSFDGSVCGKGNGIGCVIMSPNKGVFRLSVKLEFVRTNNQAEYLLDMGVKDVKAFRGAKLIV